MPEDGVSSTVNALAWFQQVVLRVVSQRTADFEEEEVQKGPKTWDLFNPEVTYEDAPIFTDWLLDQGYKIEGLTVALTQEELANESFSVLTVESRDGQIMNLPFCVIQEIERRIRDKSGKDIQ